uniref:Uncharacterized protein n=1 Tax=Setaria digitata TaxID=48799 RepID=A0A915PR76_9BILA
MVSFDESSNVERSDTDEHFRRCSRFVSRVEERENQAAEIGN